MTGRATAPFRSRMRSSLCCAAWLPRSQARDRVDRRRQRGRAGRALRSGGRRMVMTGGWTATPSLGGFIQLIDDAAGADVRLGTPVQRVRWNGEGVTVVLKSGEGHGRSGRDHRAGRPVARGPANPRSVAAAGQQTAVGRLGYGAACWVKSISASCAGSGPSSRMVRPLPDGRKRGTFNTWVSYLGETGLRR